MDNNVIKLSQKNYYRICRICYEQNDLKNIFQSKYRNVTFANILENCVHLKISEHDGLSPHICLKCIKSLMHLNAFLDQCRVSTEALKAVYNYLYNAIDKNRRKRCIQINYTKMPDEESLLEKCIFVSDFLNIENNIKTVEEMFEKLHEQLISCNERDDEKFICANCDKSFKNKSQLIKHFNISHTIVTCSKCGLKLIRSSLKGHLKRHQPNYIPAKSSPKKRLCSICGVTVRYNAKAHMLAHVTPKPFQCKLCPFKTAFSSSLNRHQVKHKGRMFLCSLCGKDFSRREYFTRHMKVHEFSACCKMCSEIFPSPFEFEKHLKTHDFCAKKVSTNKYDNKRFLTKSTNNDIVNEGADLPKSAKKCEECGKICVNYLSYIGHMKFGHKIDKRTCKICGERIHGHMSVHMKVHVENSIHKCALCDKIFNSRAHLRRHKLLVHENRREHKCSYCAKGFNLIGNLQDHVRTHTGEMLRCDYCEKTFKQTSARYKHLRDVHNVRLGERKGKQQFADVEKERVLVKF